MIQAGIKEIKNHLSHFIAQVKAGEEVMITDRGKPVARIIKENTKNSDIRMILSPLVVRGLVTPPSRGLNKDKPTPYKTDGLAVSAMVIEDRR